MEGSWFGTQCFLPLCFTHGGAVAQRGRDSGQPQRKHPLDPGWSPPLTLVFSPVITHPCCGVLSHRHFLIWFRLSSARYFSVWVYMSFSCRIPFLLVLQLLLFQEAKGLPNLEQIPRDALCALRLWLSLDAMLRLVSGPVVQSASCASGRLTIRDTKWGLGPLAGSGAFYSPLNWVQLPSQWQVMAGPSLWGEGEGSF